MRCGLGDGVSGIDVTMLCSLFCGTVLRGDSGGLTLSTFDTSASDRIRASFTDEDTSDSPSVSNSFAWLSSTALRRISSSPLGHASQRLT